ncbi:tumor necrosis factor receptor superfamily member 1B-like isoform X1 [Sinocyclocheilus anshuiensis]|uniref:Tumor necrosis factor receptor superfamily member 1B-like n=2 Tax=Sinocyclocheilus anshuiensis TaxID=1608454 RepID=A0A671LQ75_9TELE|nr:PREDICTED: tumor necrosis factor receptor superfamily member 1B-like isoform X1 [Sinocyclocheilus anshuiensis]
MLILISRLLFMAAVWRVAEGKTPPPYRSSGPCNTAFEYYAKNLGLCCSRCKPGTHLAVMCTSNSDTICEPCQDGQYSENMNHFSNCFSCPKCKDVKGLMYGTNCSTDTKAVCVCKPGMLCSKRNFNKECEECRKYRSCKPGEYVMKEGSISSDVKCMPCPSGMFSNHSNTERCNPHTQCEGRSVLRSGNSTVDTLCEMMPPSTATTTKAPLQSSPKPTRPKEPSNFRGQTQEMQRMNTSTTSSLAPSSRATSSTPVGQDDMIYFTVVGIVLVLLILAVMVITCKLRKRKAGLQKVPITDGNKLEKDASASSTPDYQRLLPVDRCQKEPSMTSSDSQSQPDSSHSSADWLERTSQESIPEPPSVSSPMVNLSITATFNCQLNPSTASCSIPLNTSARTPHVEAPVPLSQEEVCISCQQEDGKEALRSVQESSPCVF